ncbi:hypothetical protein Dimus_016549 [Dionaea muscipula]
MSERAILLGGFSLFIRLLFVLMDVYIEGESVFLFLFFYGMQEDEIMKGWICGHCEYSGETITCYLWPFESSIFINEISLFNYNEFELEFKLDLELDEPI